MTTPSWSCRSLRPFYFSSSVYSCYLFLIFSASVRSMLFFVLYCAHLCVKCSLVIYNFLERSLDFPILLFSFISLHCLFKKAFLISPGYSLELCIQLGISFPFSFAFSSLLFSAICKATSNNHLPSCFSFSLGSFWSLPPVQCYETLSIVLQAFGLPDLIP